MSFITKDIDEMYKNYQEQRKEYKENSKPEGEANNLVFKPDPPFKVLRMERKCLVGKNEIPCYFHGWFQLNTPTKDGNSIAYPIGIVEHKEDGAVEQVKVTSIKFVEEFEE